MLAAASLLSSKAGATLHPQQRQVILCRDSENRNTEYFLTVQGRRRHHEGSALHLIDEILTPENLLVICNHKHRAGVAALASVFQQEKNQGAPTRSANPSTPFPHSTQLRGACCHTKFLMPKIETLLDELRCTAHSEATTCTGLNKSSDFRQSSDRQKLRG